MRQDIAELWTDALRSGEFTQTKGYLNVLDGTYNVRAGQCCLGVLCELAVNAGATRYHDEELHKGMRVRIYGANGAYKVLPEDVVAWAGMRSAQGVISAGKVSTHLASLNDNGATFEEIANAIDSHVEEL